MRKICCIAIMVSMLFSVLSVPEVSAAGEYNYGEAMQKAIMFYEFQRSGKLPENTRDNWRGDSGLMDGADVGLDLTGGWYDAGDHVKFNLPMSYSQTMLAWAVYEAEDSLAASGQLDYLLDSIKWVSDYLIKCHPSANEFYYQVGSGSGDHAWWGPAEVMQMARPSYKLDLANPGSTVVAGAAAALASAAVVFADEDPAYAATCIEHAKELYAFAENTKSDSGYTAASGFYNSHSGFYDELSWAGVWIYLATDNDTYLEKAESYVANWGTEPQTSTIAYKWGHCWDDVHYGTSLLLAKITNKPIYKEAIEMHLDFWTVGYNGNRVKYTPKGLAWLDSWGALRYSTTTAFLASVYADWSGCSAEKERIYNDFAKAQVDYALGSSGRSFVVGFGTNAPERPHHRTAHSSWGDSMETPNYHRHSLIGALVGGPGNDDSYSDDVNNYINNEVATDYNAGFVGALAKLYEDYGGSIIAGLNAVEEVTNDEFFVMAGINAAGSNFIEIKALMYNQSGWPARMGDKLSFHYFVDISEVIEAGYDVNDITISTNYNSGAEVTGLIPWDVENNIYYVNVDFTGTKIFPGGQPAFKKEIQFRIAAPMNTNFWNNDNDYSYQDIDGIKNGNAVKSAYIPVYDNGVLVYGKEPGGTTQTNSSISVTNASFDKNTVKQKDIQTVMTLNGNTLTGVKNGTTYLVAGTDYTVNSDTVTIKKSYLETFATGTLRLTLDFSGGVDPVLTVTIVDTTPGVLNSSITPKTASFDRYVLNQEDLKVVMTLNGNKFSGIRHGSSSLVAGTDYTVNGNTVTIYKTYLSAFSIGAINLTFDFSDGVDPVLPVTIVDNTPGVNGSITPVTASFDKNTEKQKDIEVTMSLNGNTLNYIKNGSTSLIAGVDYTVSDNIVIIKKSYLGTLGVGSLRLTFDFGDGVDPVLTIKITDSTIVEPGDSDIRLQMYIGNSAETINGIMPRYKITNSGESSIDLSQVTIRYYYTIDGEKNQSFWCDWSSIGSSNVTGSFVEMSQPQTDADYYLEISFTPEAGNLQPGQSFEVQGRFSKSDWSSYTQKNDYSYKASDSYGDNIKTTIYISGVLEGGIEP